MEPSDEKYHLQMRLKVLSYVLGQNLHVPAGHPLARVQDVVGDRTGRVATFDAARELITAVLPRANFLGDGDEEGMWADAASLLALHYLALDYRVTIVTDVGPDVHPDDVQTSE